MFCPHCGTRVTVSKARFCGECGGEMTAAAGPDGGARQTADRGANASGASPHGPFTMTHVVVKDNAMRTILIAAGLLLLLPLAIPLFFGALLASFVAGIALVGILFKAIPLLAIGLLIYVVLRERRTQRWAMWHGPRGRYM